MSILKNAAAMAKKQAEAQPEPVVEHEVPVVEEHVGPEIPMAIHTDEATVVVYGHHHVSKRDVELASACLMSTDLPKHGVRVIRFVDELDEEIFAKADIELGGIIINLTHTFNKSVVYCEEYPQVSIWARFQENMMQNLLHEMFHISNRQTKEGRKGWDEAGHELEEETCEKFAIDTLIRMAKEINLEPGHYTESPIFNREWNVLLGVGMDKCDMVDFVSEQKHLLENNLFYYFETEAAKLEGHSFKSYIQLTSDHSDSEDWEKPTGASNLAINVQENIAQPGPMVADTAQINTAVDAPIQPQQPVQPAAEQFVDHAPNLTIDDLFDVGMSEPAQEQAAQSYQAAAPAPISPMGTPGAVSQPTPTHAPTGLTPQQTADAVISVYNKVYQHIFSQCGPLMNSDIGFNNPEAVTTMPIALTPTEMSVVVRCDCLSPMGQWSPRALTTEGLRGFISKNDKLPMFKIYIVNGDGSETCRMLMPQNPNKMVNGQLHENALKARGGTPIMHIFEGDDNVKATTSKSWLGKIEAGQMQLV